MLARLGGALIFLALTLAACEVETEPAGDQDGGTTSAGSSEHFTRENWDRLASDPEAHEGATVEIVGRVFVAPERDEDGVYWQMWADPANSEWNTIVAYREPSFSVKDGDYVRVIGKVEGAFEGSNLFGADVTAAAIEASKAEVVDALAAASPPRATLGRATFTQAGVTVTVEKIELAGDETRVFLEVSNAGSDDFSVFAHSARIVQAGQQYEPDFSLGGYPELSSDLVPGASTSGVVVFPELAPESGLELIIEGYSENVDAGDFGSLTWRFTW